MKNIAAYCCALLLFLGCGDTAPPSLEELSLPYFNGEQQLAGASLLNNKASVIVFLAPQCPLSENYCLALNELSAAFTTQQIPFYGCISGTYFSDTEISKFIQDFQLQIPVVLDPGQHLTRLLGATVTPEVFVLDSNGTTLYVGAIDNWAVDLGVKREVVTEFYLRDVLAAITDESPIPYTRTKPVGCFIE